VDTQLQALDQVKSNVIDLSVQFGPKLFVAIVILAAGYFVGRWAGGAMHHMLEKLELDVSVRELLVRIVRTLVLGLFVIMALQNLGVQLLPLIAGLGVAGAGIALAMQGVLSNMAAGLTIIFTRPFRVGEYISIVGEEGEVMAISLFNTTLTHPDLSRVVIPNRKIVGEILHNYGKIRQLQLVVGVAYDSDLNAALAAVNEVLQANPRVLQDPAPVIQVLRLADSSVEIGVMPWTRVHDYGSLTGEINQALVEVFRRGNIVIPLPQREVHLLRTAA
jgi:small conductance mechanosensitive channel